MLSACATPQPRHRETYVVRPHDTLYSIAWRHNLDFRALAKWNKIGPDFRLSVGQVLVLQPDPPDDHRSASRSAVSPSAEERPATRPATRPAPAAGASEWLWPTEHSAPPRAVPGGGILLFGKLGQDVRAACAGRVVYTGSGIRGYGNLIIVKHGENLLSSYAHNSEMLVHEGQDVARGQIIAHMGTAAHQTSALYFEIRLNGKPVDPLRYLPGGR
jgi:lipoprotein NlpD